MIENTSDRDPLLHLLGAMSDGSDGYIRGMEADGQRQLVHSDRIPTRGPADELTELGFVLGDVDPSDPLFRQASLPAGWRKEATDHDMWSSIVDVNGRIRVRIFYKAAFYDRDAFFNVETIAGYVRGLLFDDDPNPAPIVDEWTTREALQAALFTVRRSLIRDANEQEPYYPEGAARDRERAAKCERISEALAVKG